MDTATHHDDDDGKIYVWWRLIKKKLGKVNCYSTAKAETHIAINYVLLKYFVQYLDLKEKSEVYVTLKLDNLKGK